MNTVVTFRKTEQTEAIRSYVLKKVAKFEKYINYPMDVHVVLSLEKPYHSVEITCHAEHRDLVAISKSGDMYESIDLAVNKIDSQLKKEREKRKGHKSANLATRKSALKLAKDVGAAIPHREKRIGR